VTAVCAQNEINILDLSTTTSDGSYIMILSIDVSQCPSISHVRQELQQFASDSDIKIVLQHNDIFKAVNEINLPLV